MENSDEIGVVGRLDKGEGRPEDGKISASPAGEWSEEPIGEPIDESD